LIDYQTDPRHLYPYDDTDKGPIMKWLFVMKDHFSRLVYAVPLPSKSPQHVARELRHIFSVLGYPLIWHTDNGKEFGQAVIDAVKEYNPLAYTLTGACRTPRHQGSVENANGGIKSIIGSMIADKKMILRDRPHLSKAQQRRLEDVSWVTEYPNAVQSLNSAIRSGKNEVEPYSLVFGMRYEDPIMCGLYDDPETKKHQSIPERAAFLGGDYEAKMQMMLELPDDYHGNVNDIRDDNNGEHDSVKTNLFGLNSGNMDHGMFEDSKPSATYQRSPKHSTFEQSLSTMKLVLSPGLPREDSPSDSPSHGLPFAWCQGLRGQELNGRVQDVKDNISSELESELESKTNILPSTAHTAAPHQPLFHQPMSVKDAFILAEKKTKRDKRDVVIVLPSLWCIRCFSFKSPPFTLISAFTDEYLRTLKTSTEWFRTDFIAAFCRLIAHEYHSSDIMLLDCLYPNQIITSDDCIKIPVGVKQLLVCSNSNQHFGLLVFDLDGSKSVTIFDGSNYPNSNWKDHLHWALRVTGLVDIETSSRRCLNFVQPGTPFKQPSGKQDDNKWTVRMSPKSLTQKDGYNCGPIVCLHAWEVLSCGKFSAEKLEYKQYRETVVNKYSFLLDKFSSVLLIRKTPDFIDLACDEANINMSANPILREVLADSEDEIPQYKGSCQICFSDVEREFITLDCCNQEVHKHCIVHWASTGSACPWCRCTLPEEIKTMGEKRTLPVASQTLDSMNIAMPDFMRSENPFGRRVLIHSDSDTPFCVTTTITTTVEDVCLQEGSPIVTGVKAAPSAFPTAHSSVARRPTYSSSGTDDDELFDYSPFQRKLKQDVMSELHQRQNKLPSRKRSPEYLLPQNVASKKAKEDGYKPSATLNSTPINNNTTGDASQSDVTPTTDDLVRQVHDQLRSDSIGKINAEEESAKKRRNRMVQEASGRMRQDLQAKKMKAMYSKHLPDVNIGDAVSLKLKANQRANGHRGIMGIVVEVSKSNTIRVVTEHGIISGSRDRDFWFSPDLYKVHKRNTPVWGDLVDLRNSIRNNTFDHEHQPRLILSSCHQKIYGGQVGRSKCGCKKGCNAACSCRKSGLPCGSNCKCMANCAYAKTYEVKTVPAKKKAPTANKKQPVTKKKPPAVTALKKASAANKKPLKQSLLKKKPPAKK
jgi:hypothetical protein